MRFFLMLLILCWPLSGQLIRIPGPGGVPIGGAPAFPTPSSTWLLDEGTGATAADSVGSFDCTLFGGAAFTSEGLASDGATGSGTNCGEIYPIDTTTTAFSMCAVFKVTASASVDQHLMGRMPSTIASGYSMDAGAPSNNAMGANVKKSNAPDDRLIFATASSSLVIDTWYHLCGTFPANPSFATSETYVNGVLSKAASASSDTLVGPPIYDSANEFGLTSADGLNRRMTGVIGLAAIWATTELTVDEVIAHCNDAKTIMAARSVTLTCPAP